MWNIEYYEQSSGKRPVEEFVDSLDTKSRVRIARTFDLLEKFGINLGMPYARHLEKHLWELRVWHGKNRYSIIYFLHTEHTFILLHGLTQKTVPVPGAEK